MPSKRLSTKGAKDITPSRTSKRVRNASSRASLKEASTDSDFEDSSSGSETQANNKRQKRKATKKDDGGHIEEFSDSDDESKPPREVIIPLPKPRSAGNIPYKDERIHPNTMLFLNDLKANNNREWLRCNHTYCYITGNCLS